MELSALVNATKLNAAASISTVATAAGGSVTLVPDNKLHRPHQS